MMMRLTYALRATGSARVICPTTNQIPGEGQARDKGLRTDIPITQRFAMPAEAGDPDERPPYWKSRRPPERCIGKPRKRHTMHSVALSQQPSWPPYSSLSVHFFCYLSPGFLADTTHDISLYSEGVVGCVAPVLHRCLSPDPRITMPVEKFYRV